MKSSWIVVGLHLGAQVYPFHHSASASLTLMSLQSMASKKKSAGYHLHHMVKQSICRSSLTTFLNKTIRSDENMTDGVTSISRKRGCML